MRWIAAILLACSIIGRTATVSGSLESFTADPTAGAILFHPLQAQILGTNYVTSQDRIWKLTNGQFTVNLLPNYYQVTVNNRSADVFTIYVPTNGGPYNLTDLFTNAPAYFPPPAPGGVLAPGTSGQVFYNAGGILGGDTNFTYDATSQTLTLVNLVAQTLSITGTNPPPTTSISPGLPGDLSYDTNYLYICVLTNTWLRTSLSSW